MLPASAGVGGAGEGSQSAVGVPGKGNTLQDKMFNLLLQDAPHVFHTHPKPAQTQLLSIMPVEIHAEELASTVRVMNVARLAGGFQLLMA